MAFDDFQNERAPRSRAGAIEVDFDVGLRQHMLGIYNYMFAGLGLSGAVAFFLIQSGASALFFTAPGQFTALGWAAMVAPLGLLLIASFTAQRLSVAATHGLYWSVAALQGVGLAVLFGAYTGQAITQIFLVTATAFGALSIFGYSTRRSLSGLSTFLMMGLIGVVTAFVVNMFVQSSMLHFVASVIGVLVFAGLTAFDTQRLKTEYLDGVAGESAAKAQVWGALSLYLNFINLFQLLLSLFGQREE
ncbi:MAG: Bax inhibitor-1/YccA family protein [Hyphomonadaceae bacterium JAD_PAG50586_4]|nr:MAG: Bax inhibitor-1/YccA family protein [Hyphomonadaceae bacterium JAD_PAG50586_4]